VGCITKMTLIEALEKFTLIKNNGLDTLIQIPDNTNESITISEAIKAIRSHTSEMSETENYVISSDGIQKVGDDGYLGKIVYQVKEEN
jgi:hypothetical protein